MWPMNMMWLGHFLDWRWQPGWPPELAVLESWKLKYGRRRRSPEDPGRRGILDEASHFATRIAVPGFPPQCGPCLPRVLARHGWAFDCRGAEWGSHCSLPTTVGVPCSAQDAVRVPFADLLAVVEHFPRQVSDIPAVPIAGVRTMQQEGTRRGLAR